MTIEEQLEACRSQWTTLVANLIPCIGDSYRASDDPDDDTPGMCLTIGFTPEDAQHDCRWAYQTGDNSFSGGAYGHPHWAVVSLYRDSDPAEIAEEIVSELGSIIEQ